MIHDSDTPTVPGEVTDICKLGAAAVALIVSACSSVTPVSEPVSRLPTEAVTPFKQLADPGGCLIEQLTAADHEEYQVQSASTDGKWLVMAARMEGDADNEAHVYEMNLLTGEKTDLSHVLSNAGPYSPDGKYIVVAQTTANKKTNIFEYERATGALRAVAPHEQWDWLPNYSADGRYIVFNSYRVGGQADIHLFDKSMGSLRRLTDDPSYEAHAQFSPDGTTILFHRQRGTREEGGYIFDLMLYDLATGQITQLTDGDFEESYPSWAPGGRHIVYSSDSGGKHGKHNLYIMALDGGAPLRLTEGDWKDSYAFWSRDGNYIYFNSDRAGATDIYRMRMNGARCVRK